ncbi:MAG: hypothetical protein U0946_06300 [Patescibacteria group bacterium]|nr:hypothetical protein [Patescibacteria group bacterium]
MKTGTIVREDIRVKPVELPPVVPNWEELVAESDEMARTIDSHLGYEAAYQKREMPPVGLCPDQRCELTSDLAVICQ